MRPKTSAYAALTFALVTGHACQSQAIVPAAPNGAAASQVFHLNVVTHGSAEGLRISDLTLLDNGTPAAIQSLQPLKASNAPAHVIVVIDDVNARLTTIAYERDQLKRYFTRNDGQLPVPFSVAVITDTRTDIQPGFSQNGNAENDALQKYKIGLHEIRRDSQYGGFDRTDICLRALRQLVQYAAGIPGQKLLLFVSPGWPLLSGPSIELSAKQQKNIFETLAQLQDSMLQAGITLDMINPFGPAESPLRADYFEAFLKGIRRPDQVDIADLSLQVLTSHIGGTVQQGSSDITTMVQRSVDDLNHSYTLAFTPSQAPAQGGYHGLQLQVSRPGVTVRMPDEYYATAQESRTGQR